MARCTDYLRSLGLPLDFLAHDLGGAEVQTKCEGPALYPKLRVEAK